MSGNSDTYNENEYSNLLEIFQLRIAGGKIDDVPLKFIKSALVSDLNLSLIGLSTITEIRIVKSFITRINLYFEHSQKPSIEKFKTFILAQKVKMQQMISEAYKKQNEIDSNVTLVDLTEGEDNKVEETSSKNSLEEIPSFVIDKVNTVCTVAQEARIPQTKVAEIQLAKLQSTDELKKYALEITIDKMKMNRLYFTLNSKKLLKAFNFPISIVKPIFKDHEDDLMNLLYRPDVQVNVNLPFLSYERKFITNSEKQIVFYQNQTASLNNSPNNMDKFKILTNGTKPNSTIDMNQGMLKAHLDLIIKIITEYNVDLTDRHRQSLILVATLIKEDVSGYNINQLNSVFGFFVNKFPYYRLVMEESEIVLKKDEEILLVRETINPEIHFTVKSCMKPLLRDIEVVQKYYQTIFGYLNKTSNSPEHFESYRRFMAALKKAISFTCTECMTTFDSAISWLSIKDHLFWHDINAGWKCTNCQEGFQQRNLAVHKFGHKCTKK